MTPVRPILLHLQIRQYLGMGGMPSQPAGLLLQLPHPAMYVPRKISSQTNFDAEDDPQMSCCIMQRHDDDHLAS